MTILTYILILYLVGVIISFLMKSTFLIVIFIRSMYIRRIILETPIQIAFLFGYIIIIDCLPSWISVYFHLANKDKMYMRYKYPEESHSIATMYRR